MISFSLVFSGGAIMLYDYRHSRSIDIVPASPIVVDFSESVRFNNVPQLIKGLAFVHDKFGKLPWDVLIKPSINLARFYLVNL